MQVTSLAEWFYKGGPQKSSNSITQILLKMQILGPPRPTESETGLRVQQSTF